MSDLYLSLHRFGPLASRPVTPTLSAEAPGTGIFYFATDTFTLYAYENGVWNEVDATGSTADGLTAGTTHTIAGGTALPSKTSRFSTVAVANDAATLPVAVLGMERIVFNAAATNAMQVYPGVVTDQIDAVTAGSPVTITAGKGAIFVCVAAGKWLSLGIPGHAA